MTGAAVRAAPGMARFEKTVIVRRQTDLEALIDRFNTLPQARFYLEHAGQDFAPIERAHETYHAALETVRRAVPRGVKQQVIERDTVPQFSFGEGDMVVTVGPNGLVVNTAKYLSGQPVVAVNPDPEYEAGILARHDARSVARTLAITLAGEARVRDVTMAEARLNDGQRLLGVNDIFIGPRSHVSARYRLQVGGHAEDQSSSGIIVSTGAGSTGWLQSIYAGAAGVVRALGGQAVPPPDGGRIPWDAEHLAFAVREPWPSRHSGTRMVFGAITRDHPLVIESFMPGHGTVFSDGVEADYLAFNAGATLTVTLAEERLRLVA